MLERQTFRGVAIKDACAEIMNPNHTERRTYSFETYQNGNAVTIPPDSSLLVGNPAKHLDRNSKLNRSAGTLIIRKITKTKQRRSKSLEGAKTTFSQTSSSEQKDTEDFYLGKACSQYGVAVSESSPTSLCCHVRITEVAPTGSSIVDAEDNDKWKMSIDKFTSQKKGYNLKNTPEQKLSRRIRSYYKAQDDLITSYEEIQLDVDDAMENTEAKLSLKRRVTFYAKLSFFCNVILLIAKIAAAVLSGSISVISSLVDSSVDLASGIIIWWSARAMKKRDLYVYPQGRTKLEPVAIIILSVIMSLASVLLIKESITKIVEFAMNLEKEPPSFDIPTIVITSSTVALKLILFLLCRRIKSPSTQALAQDHRNDVLSNTVVIICGYIGSKQMREETMVSGLAFIDPIGAILISLYIAVNWWMTGYEQIKMLTGHTAKPEFLNKITWLCINHHKELKYVDTVRAFHFGNNFLVEVDIVLPEDMTLKEAHDIGEDLQKKLERFPDVERAFVHLDYEFEHDPASEHKIV